MIQELLGGNNVGIICDSRSKLSTTCGGGNLNITSPSPSPSPSPSSSAATATTNPNPTTPESLRCPRCDSANTKFCYYNNYNLTQPRHFCKTCRRYWTKGGALRNVPIGGGCRKNKTTTITSSAVKQNTAGKFKTISHEIAKSNLFSNFEQTELLSPNPMLWASQQNSHLLSLLRSNPNPNPNSSHMQNHVPVKEEGLMFGSSIPHLGLDHLGPFQAPSIGLSNSFYRNQGVLLGEVQSNGLQELYQRLRPTTSYAEHAPVILGHVASSTSTTTSAILDSAPVAAGDQFGFWNPTLSWSNDLSTTNGAYH